jgi:hypothetical protein
MAFYKRRIVRPDMPDDVAERVRHRQASEQALAELREKFPVLTRDNFAEADRFRERRTEELMREPVNSPNAMWHGKPRH